MISVLETLPQKQLCENLIYGVWRICRGFANLIHQSNNQGIYQCPDCNETYEYWQDMERTENNSDRYWKLRLDCLCTAG